ncbi:MAG: DUF2062 domain-containing protein [Candidatus Moranbacteria bacterium]|nr:DUF2062 domain-containing protein [Candidatus Moranbacteria bacterium]
MKKRIRDYIKQFFLIDDTPHKVAGGAALGVFMGITPGEGVLVTLFFAYIFRLNRLAALAGVLAVNMWTTVLVLPVAATVGGFIFHIDPQRLSNDSHEVFSLGWQYFFSWNILRDVALPVIVGYAVVAGAIAAALYFGLLYLLIRRRKINEKEHILTKDKMKV